MLEILIVVGFGALLSGCYSVSSQSKKDDLFPKPLEPKLSFTADSNPLAYNLYQKMLKKGITPQQMNQGYLQRNYGGKFCNSSSAASCLVGERDHQIAPQEVIDYCLNHENICRPLIEEELGRPLGRYTEEIEVSGDFAPLSRRHSLSLVYLKRSLDAANQGELDTAIREIKIASLLNPEAPEIMSGLGGAWIDAKHAEKGELILKKVLENHPDFFMAHFMLGRSYFAQGKSLEAMEEFRQVVKLNPSFPAAYFFMGNLWLKNGGVEEAIQNFKKAIELHPHFTEAIFNLGGIYLAQKKFDLAIETFNQGLAILQRFKVPVHPVIYFSRGGAFYKNKEYDAALRDFQRVLMIRRDFSPAYGALAVVYAEKGDFVRARENLRLFFKLFPQVNEQQIREGIEALQPYYENRWKNPAASRNLLLIEKETGLKISHTESLFEVVGYLWQESHQDKAIEHQKTIADFLKSKVEELKNKRVKFKPVTRKFIKNLFERLPEGLRNNPDVKNMWDGIL